MLVTGSISICEPVLGPCWDTQVPAMQSTDFEPSSNDSGAGDDLHQSSTVPNSLLQLQGDYASGSDSLVPATPEKSDEEQERRSDCSDYHTPAQPSKRRRLPTPSPTTRKGIHPVPAWESESDGVECDSLFDSPSTRKRSFKRPRQPWSLVKEWSLDEYDKEVAYEKSRLFSRSLWTKPVQKHLSSLMRIPLPVGDRSR
jgi:hypothetical protein